MKDLMSPFSAIAAGLILGFAVAIPFGGFSATKGNASLQCDVMGCKVIKQAQP